MDLWYGSVFRVEIQIKLKLMATLLASMQGAGYSISVSRFAAKLVLQNIYCMYKIYIAAHLTKDSGWCTTVKDIKTTDINIINPILKINIQNKYTNPRQREIKNIYLNSGAI